MIYVGRRLAAAGGLGIEPALIDPSLKINWRNPDRAGRGLDYWPRYEAIPPETRAAYLTWLMEGRADSAAPIGFVFLFFYGLERRVLGDLGLDAAQPEIAEVAREVHRLRSIYAGQGSFDAYSEGFLNLIEAAGSLRATLSPPDIAVIDDEHAWGVPPVVSIALGRYCAAGAPIPADWALAFLRTHPEAYLRTAATRCAPEFDDLFRHLYAERFRDGMVIRAPKRRITLHYRPASSGFYGEVELQVGDLPDVTTIAGPIGKLKEIAQQASDQLDAYSRYLGRNPEGRGSAGAVGLLPDPLLARHGGGAVEGLRSWAEGVLATNAQAPTTIDDVMSHWDPGRTDKLARADAVALSSLLAKIGVGIEPDVRFGGSTPKPGTPAVLFTLPAGATAAPSGAYAAAAVLVHLAAVVSAADGSISASERRHLAEHLEASLGLDEAERARLDSHLSWLLASSKVALAGLKKRLDVLDPGQRSAVGQFLIDVAAADGQVSPDEITVLTKVYALLGLEEGEVYRLIHALGSGDAGPVSVSSPRSDAPRWEIPPSTQQIPGTIQLDHAKVQRRLADTAAVAALLSEIFTEDDEKPSSIPEAAELTNPGTSEAQEGPLVAGLDAAHSRLATSLAGTPSWERADAEELAASIGLPLLDGAIERVNDAAIEICGEPLIEGEDPLEINEYATQECLA